MHTKKHILISVVIVGAILAAFLLWGGSKNAGDGSGFDLFGKRNRELSSTDSTKGDPSSKIPYLHGDNSFTFQIPGDFTFSSLAETTSTGEEAESVLFKGNSAKRDFQIHISPWSVSDAITIEKIKQDIPDMVVNDGENIAVGGAKGVTFLSNDVGSTLVTREIWFSYGGKLYQITTYKEFDTTMVDILSTWKWQ